jgi:serine/threonine-protein kinase
MQDGSTPKKALVRFEDPEVESRSSGVGVGPAGAALPFGRYVIRERMGQGGMGEVFLAVAAGADGFEKPVVVKRLLPEFSSRADVASLLSAEAKLMTRLVHPNIVQVIDFGRGTGNDYFLVMELVRGTDLGRLCRGYSSRRKRLPISLALFIISQILRGLAHAHETAAATGQRLVHRDISPGNVLLSMFGEVKVTDFGVALVASSTEQVHDSHVVGNPAYMAPEQIEREAIDERADLYGAGAVLFQMLTGNPHERRPAGAHGPTDLSDRARAELERAASRPLVDLVARALARRPEDRFGAAREMTRRIEQLAHAGEPIATSDALAEIVTDFVQLEPSGSKPVLVLSAGPSDDLSSGTELRKFEDSEGSRAFCIRLQQGTRSSAPTAKSVAPPAGLSPAARWGSFGFAVVSLITLLLMRARPQQPGAESTWRKTAQLALLPGPGSQEIDPPLRAPRGEAVLADTRRATKSTSSLAAVSSLAAEPPAHAGGSRGEHRADHAHASRAREAPRAAADVDCHGQLHVYAGHGWLISGGPTVVQAPGRYDWPCGSYSLRATSRTNNLETRTIGISIHQAAPEIVDLR